MSYLNDEALDQGLDYLTANGARVDVCNAEPSTYAEATSTFSIGNKTGLSVGATADGDTDGRKVVIPAIADGTVTDDDDATHWALTDGSSILLAVGALGSTKAIVTGSPWTLNAIDITKRDPS